MGLLSFPPSLFWCIVHPRPGNHSWTVMSIRNYGKTVKTPRRPFEKERLDHELKLIGEFGLKNKREVWRVHYALSKVRKNARKLLTLPEKHPKRIFEGSAMLRRLHRMGVMEESKNKLDYVLALKINDFLERRLQTQVFKIGLARSIHHARVLTRQRHIRRQADRQRALVHRPYRQPEARRFRHQLALRRRFPAVTRGRGSRLRLRRRPPVTVVRR